MRKGWMLFAAILLWFNNSYGDMYKYMDDKGTPSFTDDLKNIPQKYRKSAVLVSKDDGKVMIAPPPQAEKIDESLLPEKEDVSFKTEEAAATPDTQPPTKDFPFMNVAIISSLFLITLIPTFFLNNKMVNRLLRITSLVSVMTLLVYISTFFVSKHMQTLKADAKVTTEAMKKKEEDKGKAIQDALGGTELHDARQ